MEYQFISSEIMKTATAQNYVMQFHLVFFSCKQTLTSFPYVFHIPHYRLGMDCVFQESHKLLLHASVSFHVRTFMQAVSAPA